MATTITTSETEDRTATRRERARALMREEILEAARGIVDAQGFEGLSMRALGREVGVTATTLYDYFPSKDAVLSGLVARAADLLHAELDGAEAKAGPGMGRVAAMFEAYRRFGVTNPDLYRLVFGGADASYHPGEADVACVLTIPERARRVIQEAIDLGEIRQGDAEAICRVSWVLAHGWVMLEISGHAEKKGPGTGLETFRENFWLLMNGLAARPDGAPIPPMPEFRPDFSDLFTVVNGVINSQPS